jgi:hypothetical protein
VNGKQSLTSVWQNVDERMELDMGTELEMEFRMECPLTVFTIH